MRKALRAAHASLFSALLLLSSGIPLLCPPASGATLEISPRKIEIDSFYHGTDLSVRGSAPAGSRVAIVMRGEPEDHALNRKGKVGALWMNVGTLTIRNAPGLYFLLLSCDDVEELAPPDDLRRCGIGYHVLREGMEIDNEGPGDEDTFLEFIKLQEHMGLYRVLPRAIALTPAGAGLLNLSASIPIPPVVPEGQYRVSLYCFEGGTAFTNSSLALPVEKVGLPEGLRVMAFEHPARYGILAILVALAAGVTMGLLFGGKGKGGH